MLWGYEPDLICWGLCPLGSFGIPSVECAVYNGKSWLVINYVVHTFIANHTSLIRLGIII